MNYGDSIQETISGTSTSVVTLGGVGYGATSGSRTFAAAVGLGDIGLLPNTPLRVADDAGNWLTGWFTLSAPGGVYTLTRNRIKSSSNSNGNVVLGGTVRKVSNVPLADQFQIGMVNPDDVGFDIILLIGQSNMQGAGVRDAKIDVVDSRVFQFGCLASDTTYYQKIHQAADPLSMPVGGTDLGPGMPFARTYAAMTPTNRRVLLLPLAVGSTGLVGGTWASGAPGGTLYESAISQALLAVTAAQAMYPNSRIVGFAWIQGEGDGDGAQTQAAYATALKAMIAGFRARLSVPDAWFIIGGMVPEGITSHANYQPINAAHIQVANETDHCAFVAGPTGLDGGSALHYNAAGIRLHGAHMALAVTAAKSYSATPVAASAVSMAGPTSGVVSVASSNFTLSIAGVITGTVRATPSDSGGGGTFTPAFRDLLTGTASGTFTYTPGSTGAKTISITNNGGLANPSNITYTVAAAATAPGAPTIGTATAGDATVSVAFTAPSSDGDSAITSYTATLYKVSDNTSAGTANGATSPISVTATNGVAVYAKVKATNSVNTGAESAASGNVTPTAAVALRLTSLGAGIAESGTSPNFVYTGTANNGYGSTTGQGRSSMKFVGDGSMTFQLGGAGIDHAGDWMIGFTTSATVVAYTEWPNGVWSTATPGGNYKTLTTGGAQGSTSTPNANGDFIRITRTGTTLTFDVARMATPTTWINLSTATGVSTADSYVWATPTNTGEKMQNLSGSGLV